MREYTTLKELVNEGARIRKGRLLRFYQDPCSPCMETQFIDIPKGVTWDTPIQVGYSCISVYNAKPAKDNYFTL